MAAASYQVRDARENRYRAERAEHHRSAIAKKIELTQTNGLDYDRL